MEQLVKTYDLISTGLWYSMSPYKMLPYHMGGFLGLISVLIAALILFRYFPDKQVVDRKKLLILLLLPGYTLLVGLFGAIFEYQVTEPNSQPAWARDLINIFPYLFVVLAGYLIWLLKGARLFVAFFSFVSLYFFFFVFLVSAISVAGAGF